jgi:2-polyprenyl-6-methoxyphenol hydroxylase-like FAD-dependent oxidoreductase
LREPLSVGIVGGGTAGCAAGAFLARQGHAVTIYERVPDPGPVGAGITLQPTGLAVLDALGVKDRIVARGSRLSGLHCETRGGRALLKLSYEDVGADVFGLGTHRGLIFECVYDAAKAAGAKIVLGVTCEGLRREGKGRARRLTITDDAGEALGTHQLVIVADGSRSHLRDDTVIPKNVAPYPWGALWFVGEAEKPAGASSHGDGEELFQVVDGNKHMLGLLPTGLGPRSRNGSAPLVSLFYSIRADRVPAWRAAGLDAWKRECVALAPRAAHVVDQITRIEDVLFSQYYDVTMYPWNTANVVYLGDAAHAMSPQLGQGCNLALLDALVLSELIETHETVTAALDAYSRSRRAHLGFYQWATRLLTPFFQGDEEWFGILRDLGMPLMAKVPWFRKMMTLSMCGTLTSPFGGRLALETRSGLPEEMRGKVTLPARVAD